MCLERFGHEIYHHHVAFHITLAKCQYPQRLTPVLGKHTFVTLSIHEYSTVLKLDFLDGVYIAEKMLQISSHDDQCFVLFFLILRSFVIALNII